LHTTRLRLRLRLLVRRLQRRLCLADQHLHILVEPHTSPRRTREATLAVALTTGLDPHQAVNVFVFRLRRRHRAVPCRRNIAPVTPLGARIGLGHAALVNDEMGRQALGLEERCQAGCVVRLVPAGRILRVVVTHLCVERVVVGHVGRVTANLGARVELLGHVKYTGKDLGRRGQVVLPAQPAAVSRIHVQVHVGVLQAGNGVGNTGLVEGRGARARLDTLVGDTVGERVGLKDNGEFEVARLRDELGILVDKVVLVNVHAVLVEAELAGRLAGRAVTVGEVVENQADHHALALLLLGAGLLDGRFNVGQTGAGHDPCKGGDALLHRASAGGVERVVLGSERVDGCLEQLAVGLGDVAVRVDPRVVVDRRRGGRGSASEGGRGEDERGELNHGEEGAWMELTLLAGGRSLSRSIAMN
jgi:hypothetical protein